MSRNHCCITPLKVKLYSNIFVWTYLLMFGIIYTTVQGNVGNEARMDFSEANDLAPEKLLKFILCKTRRGLIETESIETHTGSVLLSANAAMEACVKIEQRSVEEENNDDKSEDLKLLKHEF